MESPVILLKSVQRAFTLVEMLVVLAIISIVTMITLFGHSNFDRSILLTDTAYTVALSIREMQTYGLSSRKFSGVTNAGYGLHIAAANPNAYTLFADTQDTGGVRVWCPTGAVGTPEEKPGNCTYDTGNPADGVVQTYSFSRGFRFSDFCGFDTAVPSVRRCMSDGYLQAINTVFIRPNTESIISGQRTVAGTPWIELRSAEIYIQSADGETTRGICLSQVGQVSVSNGICP